MSLWVFLHYLLLVLRQGIKFEGTLPASSNPSRQVTPGRVPPDIGLHLECRPLLGLLDLVGPLGESHYGGEDDVHEFKVEGLSQVKVQRVLILLRLVLGLVLDHDAEEGEETLLHLVPEVGLTRADDGQEESRGH